ncbi:MAG TPA: hypothetical protein VFP86_06185 [bacterium]|nr:hypothetical protein [bacterium]
MKTREVILCAVILALSAVSAAAEFKVYPAARRDPQLEQLANSNPQNGPGVESEVYVTPDPFEKVYQFYKATGTEDERMKNHRGPQLPSGGAIQWAFFTFDGAKDIGTSKLWAKIQRPTVADLQYKDVRDITSIQLVRKK